MSTPRRLAAAALLVVLVLEGLAGTAALGLSRLDAPLRPPVAALGAGEGRFPVLVVAGLGSDGRVLAPLVAALEADGAEVLDLDPARAGTQPLVWGPRRGEHVGDVAARAQGPIDEAVRRAGHDPAGQRLDVVAHSMGGLLVRWLVEQPGGAVAPGWARRVDDLVLLAVPNHGTTWGAWLAGGGAMPSASPFAAMGDDLLPGSPALDRLGRREPAGEVYTSVGGDLWALRWRRSDEDGDGRAHGTDGLVPTESPWLEGAPLTTVPASHGGVVRHPVAVRLVLATLRAVGDP